MEKISFSRPPTRVLNLWTTANVVKRLPESVVINEERAYKVPGEWRLPTFRTVTSVGSAYYGYVPWVSPRVNL